MHRSIHFLILGCMMVANRLPLEASERYSDPPKKTIEWETYLFGSKVFLGKVKLPLADPKLAERQQARLAKLQKALPKAVQEKAKLLSLAGRLSEAQLVALEYYVQHRKWSK